jgi:hypothetical protein
VGLVLVGTGEVGDGWVGGDGDTVFRQHEDNELMQRRGYLQPNAIKTTNV